MNNTHCVSEQHCSFLHSQNTQVEERNKNQINGGETTGRGGLLCPVWQETKAVPRCDEGTAASQCCSLVNDAEANVLRDTDEQFVTGVTVGIIISD